MSQNPTDKNNVEISLWDTPISRSEVEVLSVEFTRDCEPKSGFPDNVTPVSKPVMSLYMTELVVRVQDVKSRAIYQFHFDNVGAFRVLDEHGLQELFADSVTWPHKQGAGTIKIRNHGWSKESSISFFMGTNEGWSYLILTGSDCVEILAKGDPFIFLEADGSDKSLN